MNFFLYVTNAKAYHRKTEKFFVSEEKKFCWVKPKRRKRFILLLWTRSYVNFFRSQRYIEEIECTIDIYCYEAENQHLLVTFTHPSTEHFTDWAT
jgi:hypothetical protein